MTRFANDAFKSMRQFVNMPHRARTRDTFTNTDPYYYGLNESEWVDKTEDMVDRIYAGEDRNRITNELITKWAMSPDEARLMVEKGLRGKNNQMTLGIPHTGNTEQISKLALEASGSKTDLLNSTNAQDTDLKSMIGNMERFIDVQMSYPSGGIQDTQLIGVLQNLQEGSPRRIVQRLGPNSTLSNLITEARPMELRKNGAIYDKLLQSRTAFKDEKIDENKIKDMLITGTYDRDKIKNLLNRQNLGSYDPRAPKNLSIIDLDPLRRTLRQMSMRDMKGEGIRLRPFNEGNIKIEIPMGFINKYGRPSSEVLDPQVIDELNQMAP